MPELKEGIIAEIKNAANEIIKSAEEIGKDTLETVDGFSKSQLDGMAKLSIVIGKGVLNGDLNETEAKNEFEELKKIAKNFANTLIGLLAITIEKIWNAIVSILQKVIKNIAGLLL